MPGSTTTHGVLIRTRRFKETSLLVYWCTPQLGILHTVAHGASRPKSEFAGKLDLFFEAEFSFSRSRNSDLHNLREVKVLAHRGEIQREYEKVQVASYFVQLVELVAERETAIPEIHELLVHALDYLNEKEKPDLKRLVCRYELSLAERLGVAEVGREPHRVIEDVFGRLPVFRTHFL